MHNFPAYTPTTVGESNIVAPSPLASDLNPMTSKVRSVSSSGPVPYWTAISQSPSSPYTSEPSTSLSYGTEYNFLGCQSYPPVASDSLAVANYSLPSFTHSISVSGSQEDHHQQNLQEQQQQPHRQAPPPGPLHTPDRYSGCSSVPPIPYPQTSSLQQNALHVFPQTQHSGQNSSINPNRPSPISGQGHENVTVTAPGVYNRHYSDYTLPVMSGPMIPHLHTTLKPSDGQLSLMNNLQIGSYSQNLVNPIYRVRSAQQQVLNDRPFKCDRCPQSFNRNHDLKRHKRIHLAVKPFPCRNCDKSFSRKDALKTKLNKMKQRHILVKSCGGGSKNLGAREEGDTLSPSNDRMSDPPSDHSPTISRDN